MPASARVLVGVLESGVLSTEGLRQLLRRAHVSYQRTRTWKVSCDPAYQRSAARIRRMYRQAAGGTLKDVVVVCFDEFGPLSIRPQQGSGWFLRTRPAPQRATFHRRYGVRYLLGAYDVGADLRGGR